MPEQVVIDFVANTDSLQPAVSALESVTAADEKLGAEVKKTTASFTDRQRALDQQNKSTTTAKLTLDQLSASVKELNKNVIGNASTKQVTEFANQIGQATTKATTLTTQLRALREQLSAMETAGKAGTRAFTDLAVKAARLQDQIGDTAQRIRILASDTKNLDAALSVATGLAGAFAVAQGASALFGKENEDLQKALLKVQAALAILNGLQAVAATLNKDSAASVVLLGTAQEGAAVKTGLYGTALKAVEVIQKAFTISAAAAWAVATAGVSLLIAGVVLLIDYFGALNQEVEFQKKLQEDIKDRAISDDKFFNALKIQTLAQDLELAKIRKASIEEIHDLEIKLINERIAGAKRLADESKDADGALFLQHQNLLKERELIDLRFDEAQLDRTAETLDKLQTINEKDAQKTRDRIKKQNDEFTKLVDDAAAKTGGKAQIDKATEAELERLANLGAAEAKHFQETNRLFAESADFAIETGEDQFDLLEQFYESDFETFKEFERAKRGESKKTKEEQLQDVAEYVQTFGAITGKLLEFVVQGNQNELDSLRDKHQKGLISEKNYKRQVAQLEHKQAIGEKAKALFDIAVKTAVGIIAALASLDPVLAAAIGITGGIEAAIVASRPIPEIPQFAKGKEKVTGGQPGKDSVLAMLMPGERIVPADINAKLGDIPNADLPKLLGVYPDLPYISNASMDAMEKYRSNGTAINYDLLAEKVGKVIAKHPKVHVEFDERKVIAIVEEGSSKKRSLDKYFSWNG